MATAGSCASRRSAPCAVSFAWLVVAIGLLMGACASQPTFGDPPPQVPSLSAESAPALASSASIAAVHRRKCGNCHARVEPGSLPRATIEAALARHRRRAKLTEGQWAELIEFLPAEPRRHTASLP